ncbi:MAG: diacylglycerol/lipid kinase family protein, partial [Candidatus Hydrothermia bacterium]
SLFGKSFTLKESLEVLRSHSEVSIDVGLVRTGGFSAVFVNGLGLGFDAMVARKIDSVKWLSGFPLYLVSTLTAFRGFRPLHIDVNAGRLAYSGPILMSGAGIGRVMGGGYVLFPRARMNDGLLDVHIIEPVSFFKLLQNISRVTKGQHLEMPEVHYDQAESALYRLKEQTITQIDGEVFHLGPGNLEVTCEKAALRIWIPNAQHSDLA